MKKKILPLRQHRHADTNGLEADDHFRRSAEPQQKRPYVTKRKDENTQSRSQGQNMKRKSAPRDAHRQNDATTKSCAVNSNETATRAASNTKTVYLLNQPNGHAPVERKNPPSEPNPHAVARCNKTSKPSVRTDPERIKDPVNARPDGALYASPTIRRSLCTRIPTSSSREAPRSSGTRSTMPLPERRTWLVLKTWRPGGNTTDHSVRGCGDATPLMEARGGGIEGRMRGGRADQADSNPIIGGVGVSLGLVRFVLYAGPFFSFLSVFLISLGLFLYNAISLSLFCLLDILHPFPTTMYCTYICLKFHRPFFLNTAHLHLTRRRYPSLLIFITPIITSHHFTSRTPHSVVTAPPPPITTSIHIHHHPYLEPDPYTATEPLSQDEVRRSEYNNFQGSAVK